MLAMVIVLSWLLLMSLIAIILIALADGFNTDEWVATALFIFAFPVYVVIKICIAVKRAVEKKKRHKKLKELQEENK